MLKNIDPHFMALILDKYLNLQYPFILYRHFGPDTCLILLLKHFTGPFFLIVLEHPAVYFAISIH